MINIRAEADASRLRASLVEISRLIDEGVRPELIQDFIRVSLAVDAEQYLAELPQLTVDDIRSVVGSLQQIEVRLSSPNSPSAETKEIDIDMASDG